MTPAEWAQERIESASVHHRVFWVNDPYSLLDATTLEHLRGKLARGGRRVAVAKNAFRLREQLLDAEPSRTSLLVIDQSCSPRELHLLPRDCRPSDFQSLFVPDWKPFLPPEAVFCPTIRDFLVAITDNRDWPSEVNIYPYETLARRVPTRFLEAYETFTRSGQALTSDDLMMIGASAVFDEDLLNLNDPFRALDVAFHSDSRWKALAEYFNASEVEKVRARLARLPAPFGDLFTSGADTARLALTSLVVLRQHFEDAGRQLPILTGSLVRYQDCTVGLYTEAPSFFVEEEVSRFEHILTAEFKGHVHKQLGLEAEEAAKAFVAAERFSVGMRDIVPFVVSASGQKVEVSAPANSEFSLARLTMGFVSAKEQLQQIIKSVKPALERVKLTPVANQTPPLFQDVFLDKKAHLIEQALGQMQANMQDINGPARAQWTDMPWFEARWKMEESEARNLQDDSRKLSDDLDYHFGRFVEQRYADVTSGEILTTDLFYEEFMAPRRRKSGGDLDRAIILVMDSMRFDLWRQLLRPALEAEYEVEEMVGFSRLPSETKFSRRSFFSGESPARTSTGSEVDLFERLLTRVHKHEIKLKAADSRPGMAFSAVTNDQSTYAAVFDFADSLSHEINWAPHMIVEALKGILRQVKAVLKEYSRNHLVFVTADHGHVRKTGAPIYIPGSDDIGYRSGYVPTRVEGRDATHLFQVPAAAAGHDRPGWFIFPRPGYYLRPSERGRGRPGANYRHGGLSIFEVMIPLVCLRHRSSATKVRLHLLPLTKAVAGQRHELVAAVSSDGVLSSPVRLFGDTEDIVPKVVTGITSTPTNVSLDYLPTREGTHKLDVRACLEGETGTQVGHAEITITVSPAPRAEDPAVSKLKKIFGDA